MQLNAPPKRAVNVFRVVQSTAFQTCFAYTTHVNYEMEI